MNCVFKEHVADMKAHATAPAKTILLGEHFVVLGEQAVAMAISLNSEVNVERRGDSSIYIRSLSLNTSGSFKNDEFKMERGGEEARRVLEPLKMVADAVCQHVKCVNTGFNIEVDSKIPVAVGLGSSAATAVSTIAAVAESLEAKLRREEICDLAFVPERRIHEKPSGIDQTTSTYGGVIQYKPSKGFASIPMRHQLPIVVGNSGKARSTGEQVAKVRKLLEERRDFVTDLAKNAGELSSKAVDAIKEGDLRTLGELMISNHEILRKIGVSSQSLDRLVQASLKAGALGAKLTGAGGGGCIIALTEKDAQQVVADAIQEAGGKTYIVEIDKFGVRVWLNKM